MWPNYSPTWRLKFVKVVIHDPFWSPSQGDTSKWGNQISVALVAFPMWCTWMGRPISITLVAFTSQSTWMGWPNFNHFDCHPKVIHLMGWPISIALVAFTSQGTWMGWPNFNHFDCHPKVMHLMGRSHFNHLNCLRKVTHLDGATQFSHLGYLPKVMHLNGATPFQSVRSLWSPSQGFFLGQNFAKFWLEKYDCDLYKGFSMKIMIQIC
jgi:hypothetical protein